MLKHFFTIAWRNLIKGKVFTIVNLLGLTLGMACVIIIFLYVKYETSYEDFHVKADRIMAVYSHGKLHKDLKSVPVSFGPLGPDLKEKYPEIQSFARIYQFDEIIVRNGQDVFQEESYVAADKEIMELFTLPIISGNKNCLANKHEIIISQKLARKYFGTLNPLGKKLEINYNGNDVLFTVGALMKNMPPYTHQHFDAILPLPCLETFNSYLKKRIENYQSTDFYTYILTREGTNNQELSNKIFTRHKIPVEGLDLMAYPVPLKRVHLYESIEGNIQKVYIFIAIGILILLLASINFINLTTARATTRYKEAGLKKVVGAMPGNLSFQFLMEVLLLAIIGMQLSLVIVELITPSFNDLINRNIHVDYGDPLFLAGLSAILIFTVLLSGVYPSIVLAKPKPIDVLRNSNKKTGGKHATRKLLVTTQFVVSIIFVLISSILVIQFNYMERNDVKGYDMKDVYYIKGDGWRDLELLRSELASIPGVENISASGLVPERSANFTTEWGKKEKNKSASTYSVDHEFVDVFKIKMLKGRFFSRDFSEKDKERVVVNQRTVDALDLKDPIGSRVYLWGKDYEIIGIIDDFRYLPPIMESVPLLLRYDKSNRYIFFRLDKASGHETIGKIEATLKRLNPDFPNEINIFAEYPDENAEAFISAFQLIQIFTVIGIILALMGLLGLTIFTIERKTKEIGIRKVQGARTVDIIKMLNKEFTWIIIIANLIAIPLAYMALNEFLKMFTHPIHLHVGFFIGVGLLVYLLALIITGTNTWRAASKNPVDALRYE